jgi:hypothetical protein
MGTSSPRRIDRDLAVIALPDLGVLASVWCALGRFWRALGRFWRWGC